MFSRHLYWLSNECGHVWRRWISLRKSDQYHPQKPNNSSSNSLSSLPIWVGDGDMYVGQYIKTVETLKQFVCKYIIDNVGFRDCNGRRVRGIQKAMFLFWCIDFDHSFFLNCPQWDRRCFSKGGARIAHNYSHGDISQFSHRGRIHSSHETEPLLQRALQGGSQQEKKDQPPLQCTREHACVALRHASKYVIPSFEPGRSPVFTWSAM